ncbi:MAG: SNF2-related protein [Tissierellales bacterium]|jgi:SNF2 family DNA or RNA helicase|nr:SNF2-related protein [Tissierellales bacterium]
MFKSKKHDFEHAKKIVNEIESIDKRLKNILEVEKNFSSNIRKAYENLKKEMINSILRGIDVEQINKDKLGIRVSALKNAGIYNIEQLHAMSWDRLINIRNIGEQSAYKINVAVGRIYNSIVKSVKVKIDPENKSYCTNKLLEELYLVENSKEIIELCKQIYQREHEAIFRNAKESQRAISKFKWFFSSRQKKENALQSLRKLESILDSGYKDDFEQVSAEMKKINSEKGRYCWNDFQSNAPRYYALLESVVGTKLDKEKTTGGLSNDFISSIERYPLNLSLMKSTLRSYQMFGTKYILHQRNSLLGDEMGLGKTIQSIAAMGELKLKGKKYFFVVCPASVLINWSREVENHSELKAISIYGKDRDNSLREWLKHGGVAVSTYETISRINIPSSHKIDMLVVDEAHYVKNPNAIRSKAVMKLSQISSMKLFMTGTPIENNIDEMCNLVKCLQPNVAKKIQSMRHISNAPQFRQKVAPVYLRRVREDVLTELPDLQEKEEWSVFTPHEIEAYRNSVMSGNFMSMRQVSWNTSSISNSSKAKRLIEICEEAKISNQKIIVFSYFRDVIQKVNNLLNERTLEPITGSVSSQRRQEIIDEFTHAPSGTVLVSQVTAGGIGLNIQSANVVVFCEPQIKPSIENQAISRVYRMGQTRNVTVHRLLMENSVDERIMHLLKGKQKIFDSFADKSYSGKASLSKDIEQNLIREERLRLGL